MQSSVGSTSCTDFLLCQISVIWARCDLAKINDIQYALSIFWHNLALSGVFFIVLSHGNDAVFNPLQ